MSAQINPVATQAAPNAGASPEAGPATSVARDAAPIAPAKTPRKPIDYVIGAALIVSGGAVAAEVGYNMFLTGILPQLPQLPTTVVEGLAVALGLALPTLVACGAATGGDGNYASPGPLYAAPYRRSA